MLECLFVCLFVSLSAFICSSVCSLVCLFACLSLLASSLVCPLVFLARNVLQNVTSSESHPSDKRLSSSSANTVSFPKFVVHLVVRWTRVTVASLPGKKTSRCGLSRYRPWFLFRHSFFFCGVRQPCLGERPFKAVVVKNFLLCGIYLEMQTCLPFNVWHLKL